MCDEITDTDNICHYVIIELSKEKRKMKRELETTDILFKKEEINYIILHISGTVLDQDEHHFLFKI